MNTIDARYPIGKFEPRENYTPDELNECMVRILSLPGRLENAIKGLSNEQLDTPYREGGWTVRQVVHHVADSHMNAYIRTKWTLTEDSPVIKVYNEKKWSETPETKSAPSVSVELIKTLHAKWNVLLCGLSAESLQRSFVHPDTGKNVTLQRIIAMYAWHGDHHLAHITSLKIKMNWGK